MNFRNIVIIAIATLALASCATRKNVVYFQDIKPGETELAVEPRDVIRFQPEDRISIVVTCQDPRLSAIFNLPVITNNGQHNYTSAASSSSSYNSYNTTGTQTMGYTVDSKGDIEFPVLGTIHVEGMTREGLAQHIKNEIISRDLIKDPVVIVEYLNLTVTLLGDVGAGLYRIDKDHKTIVDVISEAGDLAMTGKRNNILVIRTEGDKRKAYHVNMLNAEELYASPAYYLKQGDVIYVEPNATSRGRSNVNGNLLGSVSFWTSTVSFIISMSLLLFR